MALKKSRYFILFFGLIVAFQACKKDPNGSDTGFPIVSTTKVVVAGRVSNEWNQPMQFAEVTLGNTTVLTDSLGYYALNNISIPEDRGVISINKSGYPTSFLGISPDTGVQYINVVLLAGSSAQFNNSTGGTVAMGTAGSLIFPPNALVNQNGSPYLGNVIVRYDLSNADDSLYRFQFPGNDRMAISSQNETGQLRSYSFANIELTTNAGIPLQVDSGLTVMLKMPIPASQQSSAPTTSLFWSFDEQTAIWKEEVIATKVGNFYQAPVSHFTLWGCGSFHSAAYLKGRVLDCNNQPLPNIVVYFDYDNFEFTDNYGYFIKRVPGNISFPVNVPPANALGVFSTSFPIGPIATGQLFDMGDIVLQCPSYLTGVMKDCNNSGVSGWIQASFGSQFGGTAMYSTSGNFTLPVAPNMNAYMRFISPQKTVHTGIVTPPINTTSSMGTILMCYTPDTANVITLNGAGYVNETFTLDVTESYAQYRSAYGKTYLKLMGTTLQGKLVQVLGYVTGNLTGAYTCDAGLVNYIRLDVIDQVIPGSDQFTSEPAASAGSIQILNYGNEIGRLKAYLSGTLISSATSGSQPVTISGKMDLARVPNMASSTMNVLTANGDGFLNQTINFDWCGGTAYSFGYVAGNYQSSTSETILKFYGCMNSSNGGYHGKLIFNGNSPGVYTAPGDFHTSGFSIRKEFNGLTTKSYTEIVSGTLTITAYPPAGGFITGTFSGVFKRTDPVSGQVYTVSVTNANISNWHYPDQ